MRSRGKRWARELAVTAAVAMAVMGIVGYLRAPSYEHAVLPPLSGVSVAGNRLDLRTYRGAPLLLHFWATWCPVCRAESGNIDAVSRSGRVVTIAVRSGNRDEIAAYMEANALRYPVINDAEGSIAGRFGITVYPTTILVGRDGRVLWSETGYTTALGLKLRLWLAGVL